MSDRPDPDEIEMESIRGKRTPYAASPAGLEMAQMIKAQMQWVADVPPGTCTIWFMRMPSGPRG